jgi:hypothetical protein
LPSAGLGKTTSREPQKTKLGEAIFYWVWFDEAQVDAEGDGPYQGGEIPEKELTLV